LEKINRNAAEADAAGRRVTRRVMPFVAERSRPLACALAPATTSSFASDIGWDRQN